MRWGDSSQETKYASLPYKRLPWYTLLRIVFMECYWRGNVTIFSLIFTSRWKRKTKDNFTWNDNKIGQIIKKNTCRPSMHSCQWLALLSIYLLSYPSEYLCIYLFMYSIQFIITSHFHIGFLPQSNCLMRNGTNYDCWSPRKTSLFMLMTWKWKHWHWSLLLAFSSMEKLKLENTSVKKQQRR